MPLPSIEFEISPTESREEPQSGANDLLINVLGTSFSITAGEDPEYLNEVLAQYQVAIANTQGISGMKDPLKVAILTGFLLCDEINKIKLQIEEEQAKIEEKQAKVEEEQAKADLKRTAEVQELNRIMGNIMTRIDKVFNG
jgi:cell division protein ZapA (FtsZ GTPase activity inhibitor)